MNRGGRPGFVQATNPVADSALEVPTLSLSVIVPAYNEAATIGEIIGRLVSALWSRRQACEIIVVDDGSTDDTEAIVAECAKALSGFRIKTLKHRRNRGKGAAVVSGLAAARGRAVVVQDADLEYDPRDIPKLVDPILEGRADVVYGSRFLGYRQVASLHGRANRFLTELCNLMTGARLTDMETCYKAIRTDILNGITIEERRFGLEPEITVKILRGGWRIDEVPISYLPRTRLHGKKIGWWDGVRAIWCIIFYSLRSRDKIQSRAIRSRPPCRIQRQPPQYGTMASMGRTTLAALPRTIESSRFRLVSSRRCELVGSRAKKEKQQ